ncbi:hypothetical protein BKA70DRAFT_1268054 [Coprinopsis sp. MPI-PUGE-AT-0042]|nr:hypothetical protein BKA70DRAFT_1268054 [Coprinopsis sp. MPI-PUGE-AT-0042]
MYDEVRHSPAVRSGSLEQTTASMVERMNPQDGTKLKIWQCFDNLPAQQWQFTKDRRFILAGTGLCLDVPDGNTTVGNIVKRGLAGREL